MPLVSLELARSHCKTDGDDDALLSVYLAAAEAHAQEVLNRRVFASAEEMAEAVLDGAAGADPMVVNDAIRAAILLLTGHFYRNREDVVGGRGAAAVQLPMGAVHLLWPYRVSLGV